MTRYIISDTHFGHYDKDSQRGIITFERTQFKTIQEHDEAILQVFYHIAEKAKNGDEFWHLGDWGDLSYLWVINMLNDAHMDTHFILGNHDAAADIPEFEKYFMEVHQYPVYLSNKLVFSHEPVGTWESVINVHGHLHGSIIDAPNYINASIHVTGYKPVTDKYISARYAKIPKWCMRFLYEPYADMYKFTQPKEDVIMDRNGHIDLSASRLLQKLHKDQRSKSDSYQPYTGGLNVRED